MFSSQPSKMSPLLCNLTCGRVRMVATLAMDAEEEAVADAAIKHFS